MLNDLRRGSGEVTRGLNISVHRFVSWCDSHYLLLNVKKTKELIFDLRKSSPIHENIVIKGEVVERVNEYKYLGVIFDEKLDWVKNSKKIQSKVNQRVFFMYNVAKFNVDTKILSLFYESCILSVISFCITAWDGNVRAKFVLVYFEHFNKTLQQIT